MIIRIGVFAIMQFYNQEQIIEIIGIPKNKLMLCKKKSFKAS